MRTPCNWTIWLCPAEKVTWRANWASGGCMNQCCTCLCLHTQCNPTCMCPHALRLFRSCQQRTPGNKLPQRQGRSQKRAAHSWKTKKAQSDERRCATSSNHDQATTDSHHSKYHFPQEGTDASMILACSQSSTSRVASPSSTESLKSLEHSMMGRAYTSIV